MIKTAWRFTGNLTKLPTTTGIDGGSITFRNRFGFTFKGWAGLYLFNIVLFGYKLWFGFTKDFFWNASWRK